MDGGGRVLVGRGEDVVGVPEADWWAELQDHLPGARRRYEALSVVERAVRRSAVLRLVEGGRPVSPELIARDVGAALPEVVAALGTLEARMFFLVRDGSGAVSWAFPVTADATPHHLTFASGQRRDAA